MCHGPWTSEGWWFVPMIFAGLMLIGCLVFFARGGFGRWRRRGAPCCRSAPAPEGAERALDLLRARLARGEIGKEEFEDIREALTAGDGIGTSR